MLNRKEIRLQWKAINTASNLQSEYTVIKDINPSSTSKPNHSITQKKLVKRTEKNEKKFAESFEVINWILSIQMEFLLSNEKNRLTQTRTRPHESSKVMLTKWLDGFSLTKLLDLKEENEC